MKITSRYIASLVELPGIFVNQPGHTKGWVVFELGTSGRVPVAWAVNKIAAVNIAAALQALAGPVPDVEQDHE